MLEPATPANEHARLAALRAMNILDTPPEDYLDRIVNIAAQIFDVPMVLISLVDEKRQWFKARHGLEAREAPRETSFCGHAILQEDTFCVADARLDPRFADNPAVTGEAHIRFYAGQRIYAPGGEAIGTLCLIDTKPREFSDADKKLLESLGECAQQMLALRKTGFDGKSPKRIWTAVGLTVLAAGLFELFSRLASYNHIANPVAVMIATVVFAAFHAGLRAGLISAAIAWLYFVYFFSIPGQPFHYMEDDLFRVLAWAVATPAIAVMTGILKQRSFHHVQMEKTNNFLSTLLAEHTRALGERNALQKQIRTIIDNVPAGITLFDQDLRCQYGNAVYANRFGKTPEQMVGLHLREIVGDARFAEIEADAHRALGGETIRYQLSTPDADGLVKHLEGILTPHVDADGKIRSYYVFFVDITHILEVEDALRKKSDELASLIETMAEGVIMFDRDGRYVLLNAAAERIFDTPREQVIGRHFDDVPWKRVLPDGAAISYEETTFERLRRGEERVTNRELDILLANGARRSLEINAVGLHDASGHFAGMITTLSDITARKRAEEGLRRSEQVKSATFATALDAIISLDHEGNVIEFNTAAERCFGFAHEDVIGKPMVELLIPPALRARHCEGFKRYLETGESRVLGQRLALPALRADGTQIEIELTIIRLPGTEPPVFTAFARDVSDVKRAVEANRRSQVRLERALDASGLALFELEVATGNVYLSEGWALIIGSEPGETHTTVGELLKLIHPDDREAMWQIAMETMSGKREDYDVEHRVCHRDGQWVWILSRCRVVERDAAGRSVRMAGTNVDITERKHNEQRLHYLATRDSLTDLTNRALFGDELEKAIADASKQLARVALISVGLDRFTRINDSLGQKVGDMVIKCIADRLVGITGIAGSRSIVARPGGDEFLVLMPRFKSSHEVAGNASLILAAISQPISVEGHELVVTASIGIAVFPDDGDSAGLLLRNADIALHSAKDAGGDNLQFFAEEMNASARNRLEIEEELRLAIARDEFIVHYQPQVEMATGALIGFEALVRWQHPQRGLVPPGKFIPVAESTGLIVAIGEQVLQKACHQASLWQRLGTAPLRMAVNVTARQFRQKGFVKSMQATLAAAQLDPRLLELEITEDALMEHGPDGLATLDAISKLGVQLAIDDFGTGYSSLSYLKRLPIDTVKIDQSFVADLPGDPDAGAIVGAIIALAHNLGLKVLAEGIETRAQFDYLRDHGCDSAQGYFLGRPQPPELLSVGKGGNVVVPLRTGAA